jgi:hypothetical protein
MTIFSLLFGSINTYDTHQAKLFELHHSNGFTLSSNKYVIIYLQLSGLDIKADISSF